MIIKEADGEALQEKGCWVDEISSLLALTYV